MAKGSKGVGGLANADAFARLHHLLILSQNCLLISYQELRASQPQKTYFTPTALKLHLKDAIALSQAYVKIVRDVSQKAVCRL